MNKLFLKKTITFRVIVIVVDFFILLPFLGTPVSAGLVTVWRHSIQSVLYWLHEKLWSRTEWGKVEGRDMYDRTIAKTITFRLVTILQDMITLMIVTGSLGISIKSSLAIAIANSIIYLFHERFWTWFSMRPT